MKWASLLNKVNFSATAAASSPRRNAQHSGDASNKQQSSYESEQDFKRFWEDFRCASSEKEKQEALDMAIDIFCKLSSRQEGPAHFITTLVDTRQFSFVVARAFIAEFERLKTNEDVAEHLVRSCGSKKGEDCSTGDVLQALERLVSEPLDVQPLLDAGLASSLVHALYIFVHSQDISKHVSEKLAYQVEARVIHILKALARHSGAAQSLIDDDSLRLLFNMVVTEPDQPVHIAQLRRHVLQILGSILSGDDGNSARYIRSHQLIKSLLRPVKEFTRDSSNGTYTVGVVSLLVACIQVSYRRGSAGVNLREDFQNGHGYQLLVQFALSLSSQHEGSSNIPVTTAGDTNRLLTGGGGGSSSDSELSTSFMALLDILVDLAQVGAVEDVEPGDVAYSRAKAEAVQSICFPIFDGSRRTSPVTVAGGKVRDLFAVQVLQDIFLKSTNLSLQLEVLDRLLRLLASHSDNYLAVQELRTLPLFILNMPALPQVLQIQLLKILEYVVTVVNHVPEQELLSLCCLFQQELDRDQNCRIIAFFVKLLSFDEQYQKVLRDVGILDVLIEDLKKSFSAQTGVALHIFEDQLIMEVAWQCLVSLLKRSEENQATFRKSGGLEAVLPFLSSDVHRPNALRLISCLIGEDVLKRHPEELVALVDVVKSSVITSKPGQQIPIDLTVISDILWALWRILTCNAAMKDVFCEAKGFNLLVSILQNLEGVPSSQTDRKMEILNALLHLVTQAVSGHPANRVRLNERVLSASFTESLLNSRLLHGVHEGLLMELFLDMALERVQVPARKLSDPPPLYSEYDDDNLENVEVRNAGVCKMLLLIFDEWSSNEQLKLLIYLEALSRKSLHNRDRLTFAGCLETLLQILAPTSSYSSVIWMHGMQIVELLGAYRISSSELRAILRYMWKCRDYSHGQVAHRYTEALEGMVHNEEAAFSGHSPVSTLMDMTLRRTGQACIRVALGNRSWPPPAGYSFTCWLRYTGIECSSEQRTGKARAAALRIFGVESVEDETTLVELYMDHSGTLVLGTGSHLAFKGVRLEEGLWYHVVVMQSKPNVLAGLFQSSLASLYVNGCLRYTGKLGYSPTSTATTIQAVLGFPPRHSEVSSVSWQLTGCYLFEDVLTAPAVCLMYALGRGYRGVFQDSDLLRFVPNEACGGGNLAILEAIESFSFQKDAAKSKADGSGAVWEIERIVSFWIQLSSKKLIFAFDGTPGQVQAAAQLSVINLVEPLSAAASPFGGLPRIGRLVGDVETLLPCSFGDSIRKIGGVGVVLALIEAAETSEVLHLALSLLVRVLQHNPRNTQDMLSCRGYHLLALFLHRRIGLLDLQDLELLFQIAACEASFCVTPGTPWPPGSNEAGRSPVDDHVLSSSASVKPDDQTSSAGSMFDAMDFNHEDISDLGNAMTPEESLNCVVLSNPDMMEHVLLDWTIWSRASVSIQLSLLNFVERLVAVQRYRNHNLTTLRRLNLVQHLLVSLQRGDIEIPIVEKLVVLLGILLEDGFLHSELKYVADFVVMTFDPPELARSSPYSREPMGMQVIVRNILLEMLIDLQMTITANETLESWHKIVSSRIITFMLDEAAHPTTMRWVMTLVGVCLSSSVTFSAKFQASGGYQALAHVLSNFYDSPEIFYILFSLMFGKPVYPRQPEVRLLDFHSLMPSDGVAVEIFFSDLLECVLAMFKAAFDKMSLQSLLVQQTGDVSQFSELLAIGLANAFQSTGEDLQREALLHKTYAARLMGGEAAAPALITSLLRFMVDVAKMCRPFSAACRRQDVLESCVDLYFKVARSGSATQSFSDEQMNHHAGHNEYSDIAPLNKEADDDVKVELLAVLAGTTSARDLKTNLSEDTSGTFDSAFTFPAAYGDSEDTLSELSSSFSKSFVESAASAFVTLPLSPTNSDASRNGAAPARSSSWIKNTFPSENNTPAPSRTTSSTTSRATSFVGNSTSASDLKDAFPITKKLLLRLEAAGSSGGACAAGATAVLDFIAEVLADALTEQPKASGTVEAILEAVPLHVSAEAALVFQGLCLCRVMNFLERRLLRDDEEAHAHKKLDRTRWSANLDLFSTLVVDRVYLGAFPEPASVLKVLEFLLSVLQLANKHGRVEEGIAGGRSFLSLARSGFKQVEPFAQSLLRNTNRVFLYCFLPIVQSSTKDEGVDSRGGVDVTAILQLFLAHRKLVLCPSNSDVEFLQCLLVNVIPMLQDQKQNVRTLAVDVCKALLVHRKEALQEILISRQIPGEVLDAFNGGFDQLLSNNSIGFFTWFDDAHDILRRVLDQRAQVTWMEFIAAAAKFASSRVKNFESRRQRDMGKRKKDWVQLESRHSEQMLERRVALEMVRDSLSAELRIMRQMKYGWVIHAENEWQDHLQQLVHERGLWPAAASAQEWQLCATEGPYRMRKKFVRCKPIADISEDSAEAAATSGNDVPKGQAGFATDIEDPDYDTFFHIFSLGLDSPKKSDEQSSYLEAFDDEDAESKKHEDLYSISTKGEQQSASNEEEKVCASNEDGATPDVMSDTQQDQASAEAEYEDDGEYLITPYLEQGEKIRFRYNCERVAGLDKHDGIFLIGEKCLYIIENYYIDKANRICEKGGESDISVIDQALGVKSSTSVGTDTSQAASDAGNAWLGGRAWAYSGGAWGKEGVSTARHISHSWRMWKLDSVHELLKRWYQLRPVAIELFSLDGCNDLLVFHKEERDEAFRNLVSMNLPRSSRFETAISGVSKEETGEGGRLFRSMARSFSKRWQNGEISNFQYLMHLNTLAGRGYNDLTQYPVFPWVLADYESEELDISDPSVYRRLDKPMGALSLEREDVFKKRYENWDDPDIPKFHYGSHYSSAGTVLFYLIRTPPFSQENLKLQGGQFDHADRLFTSVRDTWLSASQGNTADVKELIPEFYYLPEFLENRFDLDLGVKQSGEKVDDVALPPWANGSAREFIRKHREALESAYVSENLHHWIDLIFGFRQRGQAAVDATNVFYYLTYEGAVDIDSVRDPSLKASTLAQINHFGQTPRQLFVKPHPKRKSHQKLPTCHVLRSSHLLSPQEIRNVPASISQIVVMNDRVHSVGSNRLLKPRSFTKYIAWGFPDYSLRVFSYDQDKLLATHEGLHDGIIQCAAFSRDGRILVTGGEDAVVSVWRLRKDGIRYQRRLHLQRSLFAHTDSISCVSVCQPYSLIVSGSKDCTVVFWDLSTLEFVRQLPRLAGAATAVHTNDMTGEVITAAGTSLAIWSINGDCLAALNTSRLQSDAILSIASSTLSDWMETGWYITGHQNGNIKVWRIDYSSCGAAAAAASECSRRRYTAGAPAYQLVLHRVLKHHSQPVTALHLTSDLKQLHSGDAGGHITSWVLSPEASSASSSSQQAESCPWCLEALEVKRYCRNCGRSSCSNCGGEAAVRELGYLDTVWVCRGCYRPDG